MKMLVAIISACALAMTEEGTALDTFLSRLASSYAEFAYEYRIERDGRPTVAGSGNTVMYGDSYRTFGDGLEIYCDGTTLWTVDRDAREVVVESYVQSQSGTTGANPLLLLRDFDSIFSVSGQENSTAGGRGICSFTLEPASSANFRNLEVTITQAGDSILSARLEMNDGTVIDCTIPSFEFSAEPETGIFSFDTDTLDSSYVITDLR